MPYGVLVRLFVNRSISADEFEVVFLRLYKLDPTEWPPDLFDVLETLFADVDAYCANDAIRDDVGGLDAGQLRSRAASAFVRLEQLAG